MGAPRATFIAKSLHLRATCAKDLQPMRGSPILRTLAVLIALALTGLALAGLTRTVEKPLTPAATDSPAPPPLSALEGRYRITLSAAASSVALEAKDGVHSTLEGAVLTGESLALRVTWATPPAAGSHAFAKLTLDLPGRESLVHVFDSPGDIDDLWELPSAP